jgi:hopanoid biosynthesis associated radical SAM protein HpnH
MMVSPGYSYQKAPDQEHFLQRERTKEMFKAILRGKHSWNFNQSPLFLEFLVGKRDYECTPWAMPCYSVFGWQKPCYLMSDGYEPKFVDLMEHTEWERYGTGRDERCANCMTHCGYEGTALNDSMSGVKGMVDTVRLMATGVHT